MGVNARHAPIADGGEEHRDHRQQNDCDDVTAGFLVEDAEDGHRRGGLDEDDAVEDQIPKAQCALQSDRFGVSSGCGRHRFSNVTLQQWLV